MPCLCQLINDIKNEVAAYEKNTDTTTLENAIKFLLDIALVGEYVLPTLDKWLKETNATLSVNKTNFLSEVWLESISKDFLDIKDIYEPYWAEEDALEYLKQSINSIKIDKPYNPFFNYDMILDGIEARKAQIEAEKNLFYAMWTESHQKGNFYTTGQIEIMINEARKAYASGYVDLNSIPSSLIESLPVILDMAAKLSQIGYVKLANTFYKLFLEERLPAIHASIIKVLEIRQNNMAFLRSPEFIEMLAEAKSFKNIEEFALRYPEERLALLDLENAIRDMMEQIPDNPYINYDQALAKIQEYRDLSFKESTLFRDLWDMLHSDKFPDGLTEDQIKKILDKLFADCCDDSDCGCGEPDCVCGCEEKENPSASEIPLSEVPSYIYESFLSIRRYQDYGSPIILDLDGDGVETIDGRGETTVMFDLDGDGRKSAGGWVSADDGMLVFDRNRDGLINNGGDLFGNNTEKYDGTGLCHDGFEALAQEDSNGDGVINQLDDNWANFKIWQDLDQDGVTDSGELFTLDELGITSINVDYEKSNSNFANSQGNYLYGTGSYTTEDGQRHDLADYFFYQNHFKSEFTDELAVSDEIKNSLPNLGASGAVRSLWEACTLSEDLQTILAQYSAADREGQLALLDEFWWPGPKPAICPPWKNAWPVNTHFPAAPMTTL